MIEMQEIVEVSGAKIPWYLYLYNTIRNAPANLALTIISELVYYKMKRMFRLGDEEHLALSHLPSDQEPHFIVVAQGEINPNMFEF